MPASQVIRPAEHAECIRAAISALNALVLAAARDGVGVTYQENTDLLEGTVSPVVLRVHVWASL